MQKRIRQQISKDTMPACKIAILTSLVCGRQVDYEDIPTEGISHITATDIKYANKMGRTIKLLATSKKVGDSYAARVAPFLLSPEHPLYNVHDVFNAIFVHGNMLGDGMFYGKRCGPNSRPPVQSLVIWSPLPSISTRISIGVGKGETCPCGSKRAGQSFLCTFRCIRG